MLNILAMLAAAGMAGVGVYLYTRKIGLKGAANVAQRERILPRVYKRGEFRFPFNPGTWSRITSRYGYRIHPIKGKQHFHNGLDVSANRGVPILAVNNGVVIKSTSDKYGKNLNGNYVIISHANDIKSSYVHLDRRSVSEGQRVFRGDVIGTCGDTGGSTGVHLHLTMRRGGQHINPETIIPIPA